MITIPTRRRAGGVGLRPAIRQRHAEVCQRRPLRSRPRDHRQRSCQRRYGRDRRINTLREGQKVRLQTRPQAGGSTKLSWSGSDRCCPGCGKLGLAGAQIAQRDVVVRLRRPAALQELTEPSFGRLRLDERGL